ncbi:uncharacterized protein LOC106012355 [Aplysia californica]|uniref:Uncharacterized protein LOC106012355 n=1 Tax=Aplysia californica TaxID=6500 RepID=A0ABM1A4A3_APLCA|nr:uncharacterized protein LOC106012355 [Aplysia californica]
MKAVKVLCVVVTIFTVGGYVQVTECSSKTDVSSRTLSGRQDSERRHVLQEAGSSHRKHRGRKYRSRKKTIRYRVTVELPDKTFEDPLGDRSSNRFQSLRKKLTADIDRLLTKMVGKHRLYNMRFSKIYRQRKKRKNISATIRKITTITPWKWRKTSRRRGDVTTPMTPTTSEEHDGKTSPTSKIPTKKKRPHKNRRRWRKLQRLHRRRGGKKQRRKHWKRRKTKSSSSVKSNTKSKKNRNNFEVVVTRTSEQGNSNNVTNSSSEETIFISPLEETRTAAKNLSTPLPASVVSVTPPTDPTIKTRIEHTSDFDSVRKQENALASPKNVNRPRSTTETTTSTPTPTSTPGVTGPSGFLWRSGFNNRAPRKYSRRHRQHTPGSLHAPLINISTIAATISPPPPIPPIAVTETSSTFKVSSSTVLKDLKERAEKFNSTSDETGLRASSRRGTLQSHSVTSPKPRLPPPSGGLLATTTAPQPASAETATIATSAGAVGHINTPVLPHSTATSNDFDLRNRASQNRMFPVTSDVSPPHTTPSITSPAPVEAVLGKKKPIVTTTNQAMYVESSTQSSLDLKSSPITHTKFVRGQGPYGGAADQTSSIPEATQKTPTTPTAEVGENSSTSSKLDNVTAGLLTTREMATSGVPFYDIRTTSKLFKQCVIYSPLTKDYAISFDLYIRAYLDLVRIFGFFGPVFSFAADDINDKLMILSDLKEADSRRGYSHYETIESMFEFEYSEGQDTSGVDANRWIHRALKFISALILELRNSDSKEHMSARATALYSELLGPYHEWYIRMGVYVAMLSFPSRDLLLKQINVADNPAGMQLLEDASSVIDAVYEEIEMLYEEYTPL